MAKGKGGTRDSRRKPRPSAESGASGKSNTSKKKKKVASNNGASSAGRKKKKSKSASPPPPPPEQKKKSTRSRAKSAEPPPLSKAGSGKSSRSAPEKNGASKRSSKTSGRSGKSGRAEGSKAKNALQSSKVVIGLAVGAVGMLVVFVLILVLLPEKEKKAPDNSGDYAKQHREAMALFAEAKAAYKEGSRTWEGDPKSAGAKKLIRSFSLIIDAINKGQDVLADAKKKNRENKVGRLRNDLSEMNELFFSLKKDFMGMEYPEKYVKVSSEGGGGEDDDFWDK